MGTEPARLAMLLAAQAALIAIAALLVQVVSGLVLRRIAASLAVPAIVTACDNLRRSLRRILLMTAIALFASVAAWDGWVSWQGGDAIRATRDAFTTIPRETWIVLGLGAGKVLLAAIGALIGARILRRIMNRLRDRCLARPAVAGRGEAVSDFFARLTRILIDVAWAMVLVYALTLLLPPALHPWLLSLIAIYLIIAVGLNLLRMSTELVDILDAIIASQTGRHGWQRYHDALRRLRPLTVRCLEYATWIAMATLVLYQITPLAGAAGWGPPLMQAIGVFLLGRAAVEVGYLLIDNLVVGQPALDEGERKRRATIVPLIKSIFQYVAYFATFVLILSCLGFNPAPFLAGFGILGVVIGLGAQPLINDVVSGFFILFEDIFVVGDVIEGGGAKGTVEAIEFRTTRIRDFDGRLHIIRNGDMKQVVNYSRDYVYAVVDLHLPYDCDLRRCMAVLAEASARLRREHPDVLADTEQRGVTSFNDHDLVLRAATRVRPACNGGVAAAHRLFIKEAFDAAGIRLPAEG